MGKRCKVKAPHYILVTSNKGEDYLQNVGFAMEKVVLELTTLGIATCWLECDLKREDIFEFIDLKDYEDIKDMEVPCAIIAFGYPEKSERLFKRIGSKVDRYKARQISKKADRKFMKCLEAARMAPSIKNCQPWFYLKDRKGFHLYSKIQKKSIDEMAKISLGTSLYHFDLACRKNNMPVEYEKSEFKKKRGKEYFISIIY
jgi:nitroreductase